MNDEDAAALRRENARLRVEATRAGEALEQAVANAKRVVSRFLADSPQECADCGLPVAWNGQIWLHVDPTVEEVLACARLRETSDRHTREATTGSAYLGGYPGPIEPKTLRQEFT